jgi:hypothetical protein
MIYFVVLLIIIIIFLSLIILRLKSKENFILDDVSNKPKIDSYQLNNYNYLTEVKKFEIIPWDVPSTLWDNNKKDLKESYDEKEIQLSKENMYLNFRSSEGWELFKKENISNDKIKYYWRKKIIQN